MIGLWILLLHLAGDYLIQSDWMAQEKTKRWSAAIAHGVTYGLCYLVLTRSVWALLVIIVTHILIDHYRVIKYLTWLKNQIAPKKYRYTWNAADRVTGYSPATPLQCGMILMVVVDNGLHLAINALAVLYL